MPSAKQTPADFAALLADTDEATLRKLTHALQQVWLQRRREVHGRWQRTLSFGEYVVDRWQKAHELGFGEGTSIYDSALVFGDVTVGARTWIGPFVVLDGSGGLAIGDNCSISTGVQIYSHDTVEWAITGGSASYEYGATCIGNNCYIGPNTVVARGVTIGDGALVGANSLVLADVPAGAKAYGNPCRVVPGA